jgi:hypothetical protein
VKEGARRAGQGNATQRRHGSVDVPSFLLLPDTPSLPSGAGPTPPRLTRHCTAHCSALPRRFDSTGLAHHHLSGDQVLCSSYPYSTVSTVGSIQYTVQYCTVQNCTSRRKTSLAGSFVVPVKVHRTYCTKRQHTTGVHESNYSNCIFRHPRHSPPPSHTPTVLLYYCTH